MLFRSIEERRNAHGQRNFGREEIGEPDDGKEQPRPGQAVSAAARKPREQPHERGEIDKADYFAHLRTALHLEGSDEQIAEGWNALFIADIPAVLEAVERVAAHIPCYAFTNTNAEHQRAWSAQFPHVTPLFRRVFSSWQLGLRKPERAAFLSVAQHIGIPCESILFFDDTLENIEHAQRTGLQTVHVRHTADVKSALAQLY